jgi:hypothetical protein
MAAVIALIVERYEIGPIDDNVLIDVSTVIVLIVGIVIHNLNIRFTVIT